MDTLFNRFDGMYPNRWRAAFANEQAIANWREAWAIAFAEEGMTMEDVARGVRACRTTYDWPPSLPEFLKVSRFNIDSESAFIEAIHQTRERSFGRDKWSHPAVYWTAVEFGTWEMQHTASFDRVKVRWSRILAEKLTSNCPPIPPHMQALPAPGETTPDPEAVERLIAGARSVLKKMPA